jgi:FkbM family methyltransferase
MLKAIARRILHPLRIPITWARQRGILSSQIGRLLPWRWPQEPFTIYGKGWNCRWNAAEFDAIGHRIFWSGLRECEKDAAPVIIENLKHSRCFVDVGANCGIYTVLGCAVNPQLRVVAVEPISRLSMALTNNIAQNGFTSRVTIINAALGESNGKVSFHESVDSTMSSFAIDGYQGQPGKIIQVECKTLDAIVEELQIAPDFLKIDVEGFEDIVLKGAREVLKRFRPRIVLEANPGDPADCMTEILSSYRYTFHNITDTDLRTAAQITPENDHRNWLCVPPA